MGLHKVPVAIDADTASFVLTKLYDTRPPDLAYLAREAELSEKETGMALNWLINNYYLARSFKLKGWKRIKKAKPQVLELLEPGE